ncbi:asparagine synthase (glutamine-hydrolyzing) [Streptomyces sp. JJ38]|uniref:asparagine synthase (glutamine-hydrolyzing) n=1 Tax=Streptomyces sp. JJ38 TaxID=2738128 RepID=UPI001C57D595|nr:asparagine synthase (glutamine-hydrolyzing) [Streptomyces sp. JJ38]MBW1595764.1 asparagine synthase (glutamine-hydrolyzing) [Streptomyces sp. JJ38]
MCRILGHFDAHCTRDDLRAVAEAQRHGGPDGQALRSGAGWALGSNRLAVMDPDGGAQPYTLTTAPGEIVAVFNGELYNHRELRERLGARGHVFTDACDGSVIPALFAEFGPRFTELLDGMYAIALVDLRAEPTLWLFTDEVGMKPLYHHWDPARRRLHFASELPALLTFPDVPAAPVPTGLDTYLATKTPFGEQTMFEGVRVLPPAATVRVTRSGGLTLVRRPPAPATEPPHGTEREAAGRVRELLRTQVHRLTEADVPVAAITSGGLDSGLVTALAAEAVPALHTFTIAYTGDWPADERAFARAVADRAGTRHHQVEIDPATFPALSDTVVRHLGQPNADPITLSTHALFAAVRRAGFPVALTGDAADELFGGYDRLHRAVHAPAGTDWVPGYVEALAAVPAPLRGRLYSSDYRAFMADHGSVSEDITARLRRDGSSHPDRLAALTAFEVGERLPAYHLRRVDHLSMSSSVEVRLPFCQPDVVRHARSLPSRLKLSGGRRKRVLYAAAGGLLPESVLTRPKQPFTLPVTAMLRPGQPLMEHARELLAPERLRRHGLLDPRQVEALFRAQSAAPSDRAAAAIWALTVHELWRERFFPATARRRVLDHRVPEVAV